MSERPVECSQCKKPIAVNYKEIAQGNMQCIEMCNDCPMLQQKFHASPLATVEKEPEIDCPSCQTTLESVKMGNPLGCPTCYAAFSAHIITELAKQGKGMHCGKTPAASTPCADKITELNNALNEALNQENYEQAAHLRDQIKVLLEKGTHDAQ